VVWACMGRVVWWWVGWEVVVGMVRVVVVGVVVGEVVRFDQVDMTMIFV